MKRSWLGLVLVVATGLPARPAQARDPKWGGLAAVAASPDGKTLVTGGTNRVLYVVNAQTFEVVQRVWTEARIGNLAYSADGSRVLVEDDEEQLHFFDTRTWKKIQSVPKAGWISPAPAAGLLAAAESVSSRSSTVRFLSMADGAVLGAAKTEAKIQGFSLSADGKRLAVLTAPTSGDEKKDPLPKELEGMAREEFKRKNDGKVATLSYYKVPSGEHEASWPLWYSSSDSDVVLAPVGDTTWVFEYSNLLAKVQAGQVEVFRSENSFNYGKGISADRKVVVTGGLRTGSLCRLPAGTMIRFELDRIAGWPEYFGAFSVAGDGTIYGVTSAYRLTRIDQKGSVVRTVPVY